MRLRELRKAAVLAVVLVALARQNAVAQEPVPQPGPEGPQPGQETGEVAPAPPAEERVPVAFVSPEKYRYPDGSRLRRRYETFAGGRALEGAHPKMRAKAAEAATRGVIRARLREGYSLRAGFTVGVMRDVPAVPKAQINAETEAAAAKSKAKFVTLFPIAYKGIPLSKGSDFVAIGTEDGQLLATRERGVPSEMNATEPTVTQEEAIQIAKQAAGDEFPNVGQAQLEIWVGVDGKGSLTWTFTLESPSLTKPQARRYWISAVGEPRVVEWESTIYHKHFGTGTGTVWEGSPLETTASRPFGQLRVARKGDGGGSEVTKPDGRYGFSTGAGKATMLGTLADPNNPFCVIDNMAGGELARSKAGTPADPVDLHFGATGEFEFAQTSAFYWTNFARGFTESILAPGELEHTPTRVNIDSSCNAFYRLSDRSINFFRAGGKKIKCPNTAYSDVVLHEYGHGVDHMKGGIVDGGYSEGFGDAITILGTRQPCVGRDFRGQGTCLRLATDVIVWPPKPGESVHSIGRRYAGFVWELVQQLDNTYSRDEAFAIATELVLAAAAGNPADIPDAVHLSFLADDDDGDLTTCSPHFKELAAAADSRKIPRPADCVTSVLAPAGINYASSSTSIKIASTTTTAPTVLSTVTIKCPADGYLVTRADAQFNLYPVKRPGEATIGYGITKDSTKFDWGHYHYLKEYVGSSYQYTPGFIQRIDTCKAGATHTFRFVAYRWSNTTPSTYAWQPHLVVEYFPVRYLRSATAGAEPTIAKRPGPIGNPATQLNSASDTQTALTCGACQGKLRVEPKR